MKKAERKNTSALIAMQLVGLQEGDRVRLSLDRRRWVTVNAVLSGGIIGWVSDERCYGYNFGYNHVDEIVDWKRDA